MPADIILLQPRTRLLQKARHYVQHPNRFLAELDIALDLLIKALRYADHNLKCRILMLLGGIAHNEVAEALLRVMRDGLENEETRLQAAIQLSITVPALANRRSWTYRLLEDLSQHGYKCLETGNGYPVAINGMDHAQTTIPSSSSFFAASRLREIAEAIRSA